MPEAGGIGYGAAFLAGLLSFFSPCVLPLVPVNLAIISGISVDALVSGQKSPLWLTISRTLLFIFGFSTVFVLMGAGFGTIGSLLFKYSRAIQIIGGIVVIIFGLHLTGLVPIKLLYRQMAGMSLARGRFGVAGIYLMGATFAVAWQPCVGPILGAILALAASEGGSGRGASLLLAYSAGLGLPFLLAAGATGIFMRASGRIRRHLHHIEMASGILLLALGLLLLTDKFSALARLAASLSQAGG